MKRIVTILVCIFMIIGMTGCTSKKDKPVNDQFINSFKKGLSERWKLTNANENKENTTAMWDGYINAELSNIKEYKSAKFENVELGKLAADYINLLEKTQKLTKYVDSDYDRFWAEYQPLYDERSVLIKKINDISPLEFKSESDNKSLEGILNHSEPVIAAHDIIDKTKFELKENDEYSDYKFYEAIVENTSTINFTYFNYNINLVDKDGVVVETITSSTSNWAPKTKHKFQFGTDSNFEKIEIKTVDYGM